MNISRQGAKAQSEATKVCLVFPLRLCAFAGGLLAASLLNSVIAQQGAPDDIVKAIEKAGRATDKDKVKLFQDAVELADQSGILERHRRDVTKRFIEVVKERRLTMEQMDNIFKGKKQVARQISYRRSVEQWHIIHPLRFTILWDCPKGEEPKMRAIQAVP